MTVGIYAFDIYSRRMHEELLAPDFLKQETQDGHIVADVEPHADIAARDYWEQEKEKLILALMERILRGREEIAFSELKNAPIFRDPILTKVGEIALALLRRQAREIIRLEKPLVLQSKRRFELDDNDVRAQLRRLRDLLAERLVFDKNELQAALAFAVRLQFDLLTRPRTALENLIYRRSLIRRKDDLAIILDGLDENQPLVAGVITLLMECPDMPVTKEEFMALCRRVEKEIYGEHLVPAVLADLQAYQKFCANIGPAKTPRIHHQTVLQMLHERGLAALAEQALPDLAQEKEWAVPEIERILEKCLATTRLPVQPSEPVIAFPSEEIKNEVDGEAVFEDKKIPEQPIDNPQAALDLSEERAIENPLAVELSPAEVNGNESTEAKTTDEIPIEISAETEIIVEAEIAPEVAVSEFQEAELIQEMEEPAIPAPPSISDNDFEEPPIITRAKLEMQPPGPYPSMSRLIDEKSRSAFLKKIFRKDLDAYWDFVEHLETLQTWKEAKTFMDREFQARKVNPYSKEAVHLSDLVFSRYFTKR